MITTIYPAITKNEHSIVIQFSGAEVIRKCDEMEFILDINQNNEVFGIEIVNLKYLTHCVGVALNETQNSVSEVDFNYDNSSDVLSIWFPKSRSINQKSVIGSVLLDVKNYVVGIEVKTI